MTEEAGIQSMDCVLPGDWLVVSRGPVHHKKDGTGSKAYYAPEYEGLLFNVLAVSPPIMLVRFYPFPHPGVKPMPLTTAWHWDRQRYTRATDGYVDAYLSLGGWNRNGERVTQERVDKVVTKKVRKKKVAPPPQHEGFVNDR